MNKVNDTVEEIKCSHCGKEFSDWKCKGREYCSKKCANIDNSIKRKRSVFHRVFEKTEINGHDKCWIFKGASDKLGYGRISNRHGRFEPPEKAYRVMFELINGKIPEGMSILHQCDNPSCVNPNHLKVGTQKDNMMEASFRGRLNPKSLLNLKSIGEENPQSKLTESDVKEIRKLYATGTFTQKEIAIAFDISPVTVGDITNYRTWRNI